MYRMMLFLSAAMLSSTEALRLDEMSAPGLVMADSPIGSDIAYAAQPTLFAETESDAFADKPVLSGEAEKAGMSYKAKHKGGELWMVGPGAAQAWTKMEA